MPKKSKKSSFSGRFLIKSDKKPKKLSILYGFSPEIMSKKSKKSSFSGRFPYKKAKKTQKNHHFLGDFPIKSDKKPKKLSILYGFSPEIIKNPKNCRFYMDFPQK
jgi:hypothetical protein